MGSAVYRLSEARSLTRCEVAASLATGSAAALARRGGGGLAPCALSKLQRGIGLHTVDWLEFD